MEAIEHKAIAAGIKRLQASDMLLGITTTGVKPGPIHTIKAGSAGSGKSSYAPPMFDSDKRLSARARNGNAIEINYRYYEAADIPGLIPWLEHHGVVGYRLEGSAIIFDEATDADLFWMTYVGIPGNLFMKFTKPGTNLLGQNVPGTDPKDLPMDDGDGRPIFLTDRASGETAVVMTTKQRHHRAD